MDFVAIIISIASLIISIGVFIMHFRRDRRDTLAFERANKLDIRTTLLKASYYELMGHDQMTGDFIEEYSLKIPYQIQNNSNFPIIIDTVFVVFIDPVSGKHISTKKNDFSKGQIVINSLDSKNFNFTIYLSNREKINEIIDLSITFRVLVRGYSNSIVNGPQKLEIEFEN
ncbi:hypothetical protein [Pararhodonellum marinum]|uniref:hypothetical protein n=1 Tax=Pararhodonellum marinum TaxID=2755358 RepID=UPI00188EBA04|nr:hypothetical protein [Pararhodonellum marinum]